MNPLDDASPEPGRTLECELEWLGALQFVSVAGGSGLRLDGDGEAGPSPMQAVACALAACMGMDIVHILNRVRVPATAVRLSLRAHRATDHPGRFVDIALHVAITSATAMDAHVVRAIALSREKYCSVWNSLSHDITLRVSHHVARG